jgi:hypothetical protein
MQKEDYDKELEAIEAKCEADKKALYIKFAMSNAKYKKGDIIKSNGRGIILIDKLSTYKSFGLPEVVYHGITLNKDLTPTKKKDNRSCIYGSHQIELIKSA